MKTLIVNAALIDLIVLTISGLLKKERKKERQKERQKERKKDRKKERV